MKIKFTKVHGIGNDFIIIDDRKKNIKQSYFFLAKKLCSRKFGIGADGVILISNAKKHDIGFKIFNSDGSQSQMCGNGMRCFAKHLYEKKIIFKKKIRVKTKAGTIVCELIIKNNEVTAVKVDMGKPILECKKIPFKSKNKKAIKEKIIVGNKEHIITMVSMGNPHAVVFVDDLDKINVKRLGQAIENHKRFPEKTNVEFVKIINKSKIKMKVWERGAGITLACGTGACAALVAFALTYQTSNKAIVSLDGGDLEIFWDKKTNHVFKTGPAKIVFEGAIKI